MDTSLELLEKARLLELVLAAQTGDREAFGELYERFHGHVFALAMSRLGNPAEPQEWCQDVSVQAMRKIAQLRAPEAFGGWLRSITAHMAINRIQRRDPDIATEQETLDANCIDRFTPLDRVMASEASGRVHEGLARLGRMDRETLQAFYVDGRSLIEMSDQFEAPVGTIKRRLHVARKRLAKELDEPLCV